MPREIVDHDQIRRYLTGELRNTVGRVESANRAEFDKGADMALVKAAAHYGRIITQLTDTLEGEQRYADTLKKDLDTVADIFSKYGSGS